MKETEDVIELNIMKKPKNLNGASVHESLNGVTNERIKKRGRRPGRYYTDGKPQLAKICGRFNLESKKGKRKRK